MVRNLAITVVSAGTLGAIAAAAAASQSSVLMGGAAATVLVVGEGLKKSKSYMIMTALVTKGLDRVSDKEVVKACKDVGERLRPHIRFVLDSGSRLRALADQRESGLSWVVNSLDWLKHSVSGELPITGELRIVEQPDKLMASVVLRFSPGNRFRDFDAAPEMIVVPAGEFMMGSPAGEGGDDERPQHKVKMRKTFAVGACPVTRAEFAVFAYVTGRKREGGGSESWRDPGFPQDDDHPVVNVSWHDAQAYVAWLKQSSAGVPYRLLSEAEWEYCCRAGSTSAYSNGASITPAQGNYGPKAKGTTPALKFPPNAWGLRDMHGNVWEWCEDNWHEDYNGNPPSDGSVWSGGDTSCRVLRGGSWGDDPEVLRSANRNWDQPDSRDVIIGFRVAITAS